MQTVLLHEPLITSAGQAQGLRLVGTVLEEMVEGVSITCPRTNQFVFVNHAWQRIYGWPAAEVLGQSPRLLNREEENEGLLRQINADSRRAGWEGQLVNRDLAGKEFLVQLRTRPLAVDASEPLGLLGISWPLAAEAMRAEHWRRLFAEHWHLMGSQMLKAMESVWSRSPLLAQSAASHDAIDASALSPRELEVFKLLGEGRKIEDIAATLNLSANTVQTHRLRIREKLNLADSHQVALQAALWLRSQ